MHGGTTALALAAWLGIVGAACPAREAPDARRAPDQGLLTELLHGIRDGSFPGIHSVLVFATDTLVLEAYFGGYDAVTPHELRSATKVVGSMLAGIAIDRGFLPSADAPVHQYFEEDYQPAYGWTEQARAIRIRDLLSMTSGYDCDDLAAPGFVCEHAMYETGDWVQYALDLPIVHARGAHWAYNSASLVLVGEAIARASGTPLAAFADAHLFAPLGIGTFEWTRSPRGHAWVGGGGRAIPRDMMKIGRLMLNGGLWQDRRLLSREWIDASTRRQAEYHAGVDYGYIWQIGEFLQGGELIPAYWASGNGGQHIVVFPRHDLVAVFTGGNFDSPLAGQPFAMLEQYILPALLGTSNPPEIAVPRDDLARLAGVYHLDFAAAVTCRVTVAGGRLDLVTPDGEHVELRAHSARWFSADSQHGPISVVFDVASEDSVARLTTYARGARFVFERPARGR